MTPFRTREGVFLPKRGEPTGELLPTAAGDLQVNTCRNTACPAFGLPPVPRTEENAVGLPKRRGRPGQLITHTFTGREGLRGLSCRQCGHTSSLKSNLGVHDEMVRARSYLEAPSPLQCANVNCDLNRPGFCRHLGAMENGLIGGVYEQQAVHG